MSEEPPIIEGFERHHRQKGTRPEWRNIIYLRPEDHHWAEAHPEEARALGWSVSRYEDPAQIPVVIPATIHKGDKPRQKLAPRQRKMLGIKVPQDEQEKGTEVLQTLIQACREEWAEEMGWKPDVPAYYVLVAALAKALQ